ncbi:RagB/SusD family nutrient uptake outer membrane protein [Hallella multisaccharivorax]|uniref:RagB/SusD family nutrient uptake outer membrane protein n=1 Tax=Hallella multisaccharivorax TaxID=310514 RepID=UPI003618781D
MKLKNIIIGVSTLLSLTGCFNLDKSPEGVISTDRPFSSLGEMKSYLDQFYETGLRQQDFTGWGSGYIANGDLQSDNMSAGAVNTRLNGDLTLSNATKLSQYSYIRNVNFLLNNLDNCDEKGTAEYRQCVGEGYYFRAWYYYQLLLNYGEVTWISKPFDPNIEEMKLPRQSRTLIADSILSDLDKAVANLKTQNNSASMRLHRDVALALKSEVALFEATWEKYHRTKNDAFYDKTVTDEKINNYLQACITACNEIINRNVWHIYSTGNKLDDYRKMFQTADLSANPEVLWFKRYDGDLIGNNVDRYLNQGGGSVGITASLVDDYLTIDGKPFTGEQKLNAKKIYGDELKPTVRDPRLAQTVAMPGQMLRPDQPDGLTVPPLTGSGYNKNESGYSMLKYVQIDYTGNLDAEYKGSSPAIQFRYADILLNKAEALAEQDGATHAKEIATTLLPLRQRVGMPVVDFDREYNSDPDYPFHNLDKYIQAVRRERRVEQALEGRRFMDICRWAAADVLIVGKQAQGALFIGSNLNGNASYGNQLVYDQKANNNLFLTGKPGDTYRYILPVNPASYPSGWKFRLDRDYLLPIQPRMLSLTNNEWKQNPGWDK